MDGKLKEILAKIERFIKDPSIYNSGTEQILEETGGRGLYKLFEIDLGTARTDEQFTFMGDRLLILDCEASATIKLNNKKNDAIDLTKIRKYKGPIKEFYITNSASASKTLCILAGSRGMCEFDYDLETALDTLETTLETIYARQDETIINKITSVQKGLQSADQSAAAGTIWDPTSGTKFVLTDLIVSTDTALSLEFDDGTTLILKLYLAANGGAVVNLKTPIVSAAANNNLTVQTSGAGNISVTAVGWET